MHENIHDWNEIQTHDPSIWVTKTQALDHVGTVNRANNIKTCN
jgi:hypothetical protein